MKHMSDSGHRWRPLSSLHAPSIKAGLAALAAYSIAYARSAAAVGPPPAAVTSGQAFNVSVCLRLNGLSAPFELARAEDTAAHIMATAGVSLEWRLYSSGYCRSLQRTRTVVLEFTANSQIHPGALAYATPFEGLHAVVMYDRIAANACKSLCTGALLGHVMAHEITHLLQGVELHSDVGLMKAHWSASDMEQMMCQPLLLTPHDIDLIQRGLAHRPPGADQGSFTSQRN
jgi:hypothetical protein